MKFCFVLCSFALSMLVAPSARADIMIDNFALGATLLQFGAGSNGQTTSDASIYGGSRIETLNVRDLSNEFLGVMGYGGSLSITQGAQDQIYGSLAYTGAPANDLTQGGFNDRFAIHVIGGSSSTPLTDVFSITATEDGVSQEVFFTIPGNGNLAQTVYADFSAFTTIDFTQVDSVVLSYDFENAPGNNVTIGSFFATIPEPAGLATILSASGLLMLRRRRPSRV